MTGSIYPQFNVVYDNMFTTIYTNKEPEDPDKWAKLITSLNARLQLILDKEGKPLSA